MNARIIALSAILFAQPALAIDVQLGDIKDSRATGQFFNGMEVELKLVGDEMADAKAIRTKLAVAVDSTGRELLDPNKIEKDFQALDRFGGMSDNKVTLKLNNPARKAESMKELKGTIELFVPKNDPQATISLKGFKSISGKPIDAPALKAAGIELTLLTAAQAAGQQKQDTEKKIAEIAAGLIPRHADSKSAEKDPETKSEMEANAGSARTSAAQAAASREVSKADAGAIRIDAAGFDKMQNVMVYDSYPAGTGKQVNFQKNLEDSWIDYAVDAPKGGTYSVVLKLAAPNRDQVLNITVGTSPAANLAVPNTRGLWDTTTPLDLKLEQGKQTLRISAPFQRGIAIKWMELKQK